MSDDIETKLPLGLTTEGLLGKRYLARTIDSVVIVLLIMAVALVLAVVGAAPKLTGAGVKLLWGALLALVVLLGYGTLLESSRWQATVGKKLLGLRVYTRDGGRLTPIQAAGRTFIKDAPFAFFSILPGGQLLSLLLVGAHVFVVHRSPTCQAIHDRFASTLVAAPEETIQMRLT